MKCAYCGSDNPSDKKVLRRLRCRTTQSVPAMRRGQRAEQEVLRRLRRCTVGVRCRVSGARPQHPTPNTQKGPGFHTPKHLADKILQSKSALEGERKQVTVLFADVKGSMELAEHMEAGQHRLLFAAPTAPPRR